MFNFLFKKKIKEDIKEDTGCKCKTFEDQDIVLANEVNEIECIKNFLKRNEYKYEIKRSDYTNFFGESLERYSFCFNETEHEIIVNKQTKIKKYACLSCKSCLGWHYSNYKEGKPGIKSLDKYFQEKVDNHIQEIRKEKQRVKLAKEICEC